MRGPGGLIHGVVRPLSVVRLCINRLVGPDVRVAEKIAGGYHDVTESGKVVNGSETILRSLSVVRRFSTVSNGAGPGKVRNTHSGATFGFHSPC